MSGLSGNLTSPGYPNNYAENLLCSWNVTVDNKFRIEIDFPVFEIEAGVGCLYDYVLIRDGLTANSPVLGKICHVNPQTILSTRSSVLIQFVSDMSVGKRGFYLRWRALPKVPLLLPDGKSQKFVCVLAGHQTIFFLRPKIQLIASGVHVYHSIPEFKHRI